MSVEERQRRLNELARAYMSGRLDLAAFASATRALRPDYASAVRTIVRQRTGKG